jgi:hypothetical protein
MTSRSVQKRAYYSVRESKIVITTLLIAQLSVSALAGGYPDISTVPADLTIPPVAEGGGQAGVRVAITPPEYKDTAVHHVLYLPENWQPGKKFPVLVEYAGNGNYRNEYGDLSAGVVEGSQLGYGISGGCNYIWLCLPFVSEDGKHNETIWWGNVEATVAYAKREVARVCAQWGGDPEKIVLCGFSRGAIACGYIGLHDDEIAALWRAFIAYSHYDGVREWPYPESDKAAAMKRLQRLATRPSFIIDTDLEPTRSYIESTGVDAPFTYYLLAFRNHNDAWTLRDIPARRAVRDWLERVLE